MEWEPTMEGGRLIHTKQPWMWYDASQIWVSENEMKLWVEKKPNTIHHWDGKTYNPKIAVGIARSVKTFLRGNFSAEIMMPSGKNLWPSFWLVGADKDWPLCGEIDIVESWSNRCSSYFRFTIPQPPYLVPSWKTTTNVHWSENGEYKYTGSRSLPLIFSLKNPSNTFVKYELIWESDRILFLVDGKTIRCYGYDVAKHLSNSLQRVIFNNWVQGEDCSLKQPMIIRNFKYEPLVCI